MQCRHFPDGGRKPRSTDQLVATPVPEPCRTCKLPGAALCHAAAVMNVAGVRPPRTLRVGRDAPVFGEKRRAPLGALRRGYLRKVWLSRDGRRSLLDLDVPGTVVGALPGHRDNYVLEAATAAELCVFDSDSVRRLMAADGPFRHQIVKLAADRHLDQLEMIWRRGALTSRERIIAFLVQATEIMPVEPRPDGSVVVTIEISRADWADLTNTTVESICRTLRQLADKQLIAQVAPGRYRIRDVAVLARLAGMDPELDRSPRHSAPTAATALDRHSPLTAINAPGPRISETIHASDFRPPTGGPEDWRQKDGEGKIAG